MEQGDLAGALTHAEEILSHWDGSVGPLGAIPPLEIHWACYRVLHAAGDPRAGEILKETHSLLREIAAKIDDERLCRSFLENVPAHREIAREYLGAHGTY